YLVNGDGTLTETEGDDDGVAEYQFAASDDGIVVLNFADPHHENVNFDVVSGAMVESALYDPSLSVGSCLPEVLESACFEATSGSINVPAQSSLLGHQGRMVLMIISGHGTAYANNYPTFAGQDMTLIQRMDNPAGGGITSELWGILDADMPAAAGSYAGSFSGVSTPSMCLMAVDQVKQGFPVMVSPPETGPLNASEGAVNQIGTTLTTTANNSLVVAA